VLVPRHTHTSHRYDNLVEKPPIQIMNCLAFGLPNIQVCDADTVALTGSTISSSDLRHRKCNKNQQSTTIM